ncbi:MAG: hypothetical protein CMC82_01950 [Flavobacteriaceae bacterium]|nr:hypothetical protein [Flavobacteriaceae bacterium]
MNWTYNGEEITHISQFPKNTYGFIYRITHLPSDKSYIGKKVLLHHRKVKVTKKDLLMYEGVKGRKPTHKRVTKESDWKTYYGSNKILLELSNTESPENFERHIIKLTPNKKLHTYYETQYQFMYQVLEKPDKFFNDNILGKFFTKDLASQ